MSLILDALRKMEQERKVKRGGLNIRPEVLNRRSGAPRPAGARLPLIVGGIALIAVGIGAGTFLKGNPDKDRQSTPPVVRSETAPESAPVAAQVPVTTQSPAVAPQPSTVQPLPTATAPPKPAPSAAPSPKRQSAEGGSPSVAVEGAGSGITISGIAWQDERSLRRAVVNGSLVGEGAEVAGARVVEIGENRVRFSRGGHVFDVPYASGFSSR